MPCQAKQKSAVKVKVQHSATPVRRVKKGVMTSKMIRASLSEPHTIAWLHCTCVCVSDYAWTDYLPEILNVRIYENCKCTCMSAFKYLMIECLHIDVDVYFSREKEREGYCQTAGSAWKRVRAKMIQVECIGSTHGNLLSELWYWRSRDKTG